VEDVKNGKKNENAERFGRGATGLLCTERRSRRAEAPSLVTVRTLLLIPTSGRIPVVTGIQAPKIQFCATDYPSFSAQPVSRPLLVAVGGAFTSEILH
jgi:hypothetical protein